MHRNLSLGAFSPVLRDHESAASENQQQGAGDRDRRRRRRLIAGQQDRPFLEIGGIRPMNAQFRVHVDVIQVREQAVRNVGEHVAGAAAGIEFIVQQNPSVIAEREAAIESQTKVVVPPNGCGAVSQPVRLPAAAW